MAAIPSILFSLRNNFLFPNFWPTTLAAESPNPNAETPAKLAEVGVPELAKSSHNGKDKPSYKISYFLNIPKCFPHFKFLQFLVWNTSNILQ